MHGRDVVHAPAGPGLARLLERARYGSYFEVLGLTRDAPFADVARRARELMILLDRASEEPGSGLETAEREEIRWSVREAWRVLSDAALRERYSLGLARLTDDLEGGHDGPAHD
jgi:preprotein translocase subunit Sec63